MQKILKHVVGKSTLREGFAIPRDFEEWICAPERGSKREITILFKGRKTAATLRRIDNQKGSVQVKYEIKAAELFRNWLSQTFTVNSARPNYGYIEFHKMGPDVYKAIPFPISSDSKPSLNIENWLFHRGTEKLLELDTPLAEIPIVVHDIPFNSQEGQSFYNRAFSQGFQSWNWRSECKVMKELGLKCDFAKDGVQVEVEFGNARTYYQDFVKFLLGNHYSNVLLGVLIVPSSSFAKHLCDVGKRRAIEKGRTQYSGMIDFDKVYREFSYLKFMLPMPIAIAGIGSTVL